MIDEINRSDLARVLGEAVVLFEVGESTRSVRLPHTPEGYDPEFRLSAHLHVLGTRNTADRTSARMDIAIRRRVAFIEMWPDLIASVRWTLSRLKEDLSTVAWSLPAKHLLRRTAELQREIGPGTLRRPSSWVPSGSSEWVTAAAEAMTWVAEERGLGGARSLDGLAWDLSIDAVWEAWVAAFSADLGPLLGMVASPFRAARRFLRWEGPVRSMGALIPDVELRGNNRVVWLDAKYKTHLEFLARRGWLGLSDEVQAEHRADLHQALAYASLADVTQVDTLLVYPQVGDDPRSPATVATVTSGRRRVRLILAQVPFGYRNPEHQQLCLRSFRDLLAA